jgi:hypothetical protein
VKFKPGDFVCISPKGEGDWAALRLHGTECTVILNRITQYGYTQVSVRCNDSHKRMAFREQDLELVKPE